MDQFILDYIKNDKRYLSSLKCIKDLSNNLPKTKSTIISTIVDSLSNYLHLSDDTKWLQDRFKECNISNKYLENVKMYSIGFLADYAEHFSLLENYLNELDTREFKQTVHAKVITIDSHTYLILATVPNEMENGRWPIRVLLDSLEEINVLKYYG